MRVRESLAVDAAALDGVGAEATLRVGVQECHEMPRVEKRIAWSKDIGGVCWFVSSIVSNPWVRAGCNGSMGFGSFLSDLLRGERIGVEGGCALRYNIFCSKSPYFDPVGFHGVIFQL